MTNHWLSARKRRQNSSVFYFELIGEFPESLVKLETSSRNGRREMIITAGSTVMVNYLIGKTNAKKMPPVTDGILKVCYQGDLKEIWDLQDVRPIQIGLDRNKNSYVGHFCFDCYNIGQMNSKYFEF